MSEKSEIELTPKQKKFCERYVFHLNATKAALEAGYSEKTSYAIGPENLKKPEIKNYIAELQNDIAKSIGITSSMVADEYRKLAFSNISNLHKTWIERKDFEALSEEEKASIQEIDTKVLKKNTGLSDDGEPIIIDVEYVKIKLYDKKGALDSLTKMLGLNQPEKIEHSGSVITGIEMVKPNED